MHPEGIEPLQDLLVAPDADLLRVWAPWDTGVGRAVEAVLVLGQEINRFGHSYRVSYFGQANQHIKLLHLEFPLRNLTPP